MLIWMPGLRRRTASVFTDPWTTSAGWAQPWESRRTCGISAEVRRRGSL